MRTKEEIWKKIRWDDSLKNIPEEELTQEICNDFYSQKKNLNEIPRKFITPEMVEDYVKRKESLKEISLSLISKNLYLNFLNLYKDDIRLLKRLPIELISPKLVVFFAKKHIGEDRWFTYIPNEVLIQEVCEMYYKQIKEKTLRKNPNSRYISIPRIIPFEFYTEEMFYEMFKKTKSIENIPKKYITKEMCNIYFQEYSSKQEQFLIWYVPEEYITEEMCQHYFKNEDIFSIPENMRSKTLCDYYYNHSGQIDGIPEEYITKEMSEEYYRKSVGSFFGISLIPEQYRTMEMYKYYFTHQSLSLFPKTKLTKGVYEAYFEVTKKIADIPEEYITGEMANQYFELKQDIQFIPEKFITKQMAEIYFAREKDITYIPEKHITKEMSETYFSYIKQKPVERLKLEKIPRQFRTKEMSELYTSLPFSFEIEEIPEEYRTQRICEKYFSRYANGKNAEDFDIELIPEEYRSENMYILYIKNHDINSVNLPLEPQVLYEYYYKYSNNFDINNVPKEYRTETMYRSVFLKHNLEIFPKEEITQELCNFYFKVTNTTKTIPLEFMTQEMYEQRFNEYKELDVIPMDNRTVAMYEEYCKIAFNHTVSINLGDEDMVEFFMDNPEYCPKLNYKQFLHILAKELESILTGETSVNIICAKYNVDITILKETLKYIDGNKLEELKEIIAEDFGLKNPNEQSEYAAITFQRMDFVRALVHSLGPVDYNGLTKEQKMKFAYNFYSQRPLREVDVMYNWFVYYGKAEDKDVLNFFKNQLKTKYSGKNNLNKEIMSKKEQEQINYDTKWLNKYRVNKHFKGNLKWNIPQDNGEIITIDKETAQEIVNIMVSKEIPRRQCLVTEAIHRYVGGDKTLNQFAQELQASEIIINPSEQFAGESHSR